VLRPDGVCFINVGDSWSSGGARRGQKRDTGGIGLSSCQDYGQLSESPCDGCVSLFVDRISGSGDGLISRYQNVDGLSSLLRMVAGKLRSHISGSSPRVDRNGDDSQRLCSSLDTLVVSALDALVSTSLLSSVQFQDEYLRMDSLSSCLSATFSAFRESLQCEHKMACPFLSHLIDGGVQVNVASERSRYDTSLTGGALGYRIWGRVFDLLSHRYSTIRPHRSSSIKPLDMVLIPEQLAVAARTDGWYVRSILIWAKGVSGSDEYNGNPMPESVNGWRWERHRIKVKSSVRGRESWPTGASVGQPQGDHRNGVIDGSSEWQDCPGCPKCEKNNGYVLRKGSWRPTDSYEHILMLTKTNHYFCDREAVLEQNVSNQPRTTMNGDGNGELGSYGYFGQGSGSGGRNLRSVLLIPTTGYKGAHFAVYNPKLIEPLIKSATSEKGCCPKCGSPWARVIDKGFTVHDGDTESQYQVGTTANRLALLRQASRERGSEYASQSSTIGWLPTCECGTQETEPCRVLDPFSGAGTTALVAERLGLDSIGIDTSAEYIALAEARLAEDEQKRIDEQIKQLRKEAKLEAKLSSKSG